MPGKRVLICDDDLHILRAAEFKLRRAGLEVTCAHDGLEAWERIQAEKPDLLVTDCQMPRLDGLTLARRLSEDPELADLPVVMLTAKGFELARRNETGCENLVAILAKPFSPRELLRCIEQVLETGAYVRPAAAI